MLLTSSLRRVRLTVAAVLASAAIVALVSPAPASVVLSGTGTGVNPISAMAIFTFGTGTNANYLDVALTTCSRASTSTSRPSR